MSATKILTDQILLVSTVVLAFVWAAIQPSPARSSPPAPILNAVPNFEALPGLVTSVVGIGEHSALAITLAGVETDPEPGQFLIDHRRLDRHQVAPA
jgi:hypothetical protein